jgi:hypothetical protein
MAAGFLFCAGFDFFTKEAKKYGERPGGRYGGSRFD